jgi:bifunctional DNA-binding transcriptional regulator/antitoxin component of YhaV-PrlF toxin-antitoxin module
LVWVGGVVWVLGVVGEVFVARVLVGGKVTVPFLVRDVLKIEEGDYVRVTITEVIKRQGKKERVGKVKGKR